MTTIAMGRARCALAPLDASRILILLRGGPFDQQDVLATREEWELGVVVRGSSRYRLSFAVSTLPLGEHLVQVFDWVDPFPVHAVASPAWARRAGRHEQSRRLN